MDDAIAQAATRRLDSSRHIRIGHRNGPIRTRAEWLDAWIMRGVQEPVVH
jgi:hypothetical protein